MSCGQLKEMKSWVPYFYIFQVHLWNETLGGCGLFLSSFFSIMSIHLKLRGAEVGPLWQAFAEVISAWNTCVLGAQGIQNSQAHTQGRTCVTNAWRPEINHETHMKVEGETWLQKQFSDTPKPPHSVWGRGADWETLSTAQEGEHMKCRMHK